jgi:hypothetical protein
MPTTFAALMQELFSATVVLRLARGQRPGQIVESVRFTLGL